MGKGRPIWRSALVTASVAIGVFLAACSHGPITPAPVYTGSARVTEPRLAAIPARQPVAGAAETHRTMAPPAPPVGRTAQAERASQRPIVTGNHPTRVQKKARAQLATRQVAAPRKRQATTYPVPGRAAIPTAAAETIPLDQPAALTAQPASVPPAGATAPERTKSSWVSPPPVEPANTEPQQLVR
jgi:hypothetical protein